MSNALNFLVVEDDPVDAQNVCKILNDSDPHAHADRVETLQQAKDRVKSHHYDAVILDLGLPDSSGIDGVIEFQATSPELPLVVLTGNQDEKTALKSMDIGAEDFVDKNNLNAPAFCRTVRMAMERHRHKHQIYRDLSRLRVSLDDAMQQATTDPLTKLPNRRGLEQYLDLLSRTRRETPIQVALADLDQFKRINDELGHHVGDEVLREFASRMQHGLRASDFCARIGGDEFVIVFGGINRQEARKLGERIVNRTSAEPAKVGGRLVSFSTTMALTEVSPAYVDLEQILVDTHSLLESGKWRGKNRLECPWDVQDGAAGAAPENSMDSDFDSESLVMGTRALRRVGFGDLAGHFLNFGIGAPSWPMSAPAISRARMSHRLPEMTVTCLRRAAEWMGRQGKSGFLHLDLEADALKAWAISEMLKMFPDEQARNHCVLFFHTDFPTLPGSGGLSELNALRQAGFRLGARCVGDGSTILENLQQFRPDCIRFDSALTYHCGAFQKKSDSIARLMAMLSPLNAEYVAEEVDLTGDLEALRRLGFFGYYDAWLAPTE